MKKYSISLFILVVLSLGSYAQQLPMFTQYMYNGLMINPAYAGNKQAVEFNVLHRRQFDGIEGAPQTQLFNVHSPLRGKNMALGLRIYNETMGPAVMNNGLGVAYAYKINFRKSRLSMGLEANVMNQSIDFPKLRRNNANDQAIPTTKESVFIPDASAGIYYDQETFFAGFAMNNLFNNKYVYEGVNNRNLNGNLFRHSYLYTGAIFKVAPKIQITPALLAKYVSGAPIQVDINAIGVYNEMLSLGMGYRTDNSIAGIFRFTFQKKISVGYSYDFATSPMGTYHRGNHEVMLSYRLAFPPAPGQRIVHPRYYF